MRHKLIVEGGCVSSVAMHVVDRRGAWLPAGSEQQQAPTCSSGDTGACSV